MPSPSHQQRVNAFAEAMERKQLAKARAMFAVIDCLAQARHYVTDTGLNSRISLALLNCHLAFEGDLKPDLPKDVIPIARRG